MGQKDSCQQQLYKGAPDIRGSDHRPVLAVFSVIPRGYAWGRPEAGVSPASIIISEVFVTLPDTPETEVLSLKVSSAILNEDVPCDDVTFRSGRWMWREKMLSPFVAEAAVRHHFLRVSVIMAETISSSQNHQSSLSNGVKQTPSHPRRLAGHAVVSLSLVKPNEETPIT